MNRPRSRTILFLAANPANTNPLRLDEESREIDAGLRRARQRDGFEFRQSWAVRPQDLQRAILDYDPQIVHFAGHGAGEQGLVLEDEAGNAQPVSAEALGSLFELYPQVECVLLNACYSELQAKAIVQHVQYVIGMKQAIGDKAAIRFATAFYDALGAGKPIDFAFNSGCTAIKLAGIAEDLTPVLSRRDGPSVNPLPRGGDQPAPPPVTPRSDAFNKVQGRIADPTRGQLVRPTFQCSGTVTGMDSTLSLWLAVEAGNRFWPKENKVVVDQNNGWSATVFEDGAVNEFAVGLYLGDAALDTWILKWLERGRRTGSYPELKGMRDASRLDRVDRLRLKRGAPNKNP
jgi:CHAT domain